MIIKIKEVSTEELAKLFPVVAEAEYKLIAGSAFAITPQDYKQLTEQKCITLGEVSIPEDIIEINRAGVSELQAKVAEEVSRKFIYSDEVVDVLISGVEMNKNVILYGRGGHGKSEITQEVMNILHRDGHLKAKPFVQAFGDGLSEEKLFGGMNIKKYKEHGVIEYLPENSFMNHEVVVFEEIFDAPANILLSLKDIMTSGYFRQGNEVFKVKTKTIIGLTNKSKEEFSEKSDSLKALAERFALTLKVEWNKYGKVDFIKLFKKVLGAEYCETHKEKLSTLADIIDMNNVNQGSFVSPRTAIHAAQLYCAGKKLEYISEIDPQILKDYNNKIMSEVNAIKERAFLSSISEYIENQDLELQAQSDDFLKALNQIQLDQGKDPIDIIDESKNTIKVNTKLRKVDFLLGLVDRYNFSPSNFKAMKELKSRLNTMKTNFKKTA